MQYRRRKAENKQSHLDKALTAILSPAFLAVCITGGLGPCVVEKITEKVENKKIQAELTKTLINSIENTNYGEVSGLMKASVIAQTVKENQELFGIKFSAGENIIKNLLDDYESKGITNLKADIVIERNKEKKTKEKLHETESALKIKKNDLEELEKEKKKVEESGKAISDKLKNKILKVEAKVGVIESEKKVLENKSKEQNKLLEEKNKKLEAEYTAKLEAIKDKVKSKKALKEAQEVINSGNADRKVLSEKLEKTKTALENQIKQTNILMSSLNLKNQEYKDIKGNLDKKTEELDKKTEEFEKLSAELAALKSVPIATVDSVKATKNKATKNKAAKN